MKNLVETKGQSKKERWRLGEVDFKISGIINVILLLE